MMLRDLVAIGSTVGLVFSLGGNVGQARASAQTQMALDAYKAAIVQLSQQADDIKAELKADYERKDVINERLRSIELQLAEIRANTAKGR